MYSASHQINAFFSVCCGEVRELFHMVNHTGLPRTSPVTPVWAAAWLSGTYGQVQCQIQGHSGRHSTGQRQKVFAKSKS